jgi:hypothetical protein
MTTPDYSTRLSDVYDVRELDVWEDQDLANATSGPRSSGPGAVIRRTIRIMAVHRKGTPCACAHGGTDHVHAMNTRTGKVTTLVLTRTRWWWWEPGNYPRGYVLVERGTPTPEHTPTRLSPTPPPSGTHPPTTPPTHPHG